MTTTKAPAAQVGAAKKAAKAASKKPPVNRRTNIYVERAKALKGADALRLRLLGKPEVMAIANASFPTLWQWMRDGKFPRSRIVNGRSMWLSTEIDAWLAGLPLRPLKGDDEEAAHGAS